MYLCILMSVDIVSLALVSYPVWFLTLFGEDLLMLNLQYDVSFLITSKYRPLFADVYVNQTSLQSLYLSRCDL